jgi:hypothetical protein
MGFLDKLFGRDQSQQQRQQWTPQSGNQYGGQVPRYNPYAGQRTQRLSDQPTDEQAIERYRYLLRTAPPDTVEQVHAEAFAQLTPEQRRMVLQQLTQALPASERQSNAYQNDDPQTLARMATRAEMRQPGTLERTFGGVGGGVGGMGGGMSMGGLMAGSFLSTIAGVMVGSMIANAFFDNSGYSDSGVDANGESYDGGDQGDYGDYGADNSDVGSGGSFGDSGDYGGGDFGDFGGGDFGGGDF